MPQKPTNHEELYNRLLERRQKRRQLERAGVAFYVCIPAFVLLTLYWFTTFVLGILRDIHG
jgi:hypothetical protein